MSLIAVFRKASFWVDKVTAVLTFVTVSPILVTRAVNASIFWLVDSTTARTCSNEREILGSVEATGTTGATRATGATGTTGFWAWTRGARVAFANSLRATATNHLHHSNHHILAHEHEYTLLLSHSYCYARMFGYAKTLQNVVMMPDMFLLKEYYDFFKDIYCYHTAKQVYHLSYSMKKNNIKYVTEAFNDKNK
ncbi:hypothetical protein J3Q64DRAFT_1693270 [Phycomyces blakesleeanus]|uniref:Fatty acid desaturase domain-containing protein n=1 Tax=Phycomyces blakesleeanus TaxID=4837 RepID=A0ABR3BDC1_PHYBL